jgi:hypothetical protein
MARASVDRTQPVNVLAAIERLTETDLQVLRLVAEHEVMSSEQLTALCFPNPARVADAAVRLDYLATRALLVKFGHPGTHRPLTILRKLAVRLVKRHAYVSLRLSLCGCLSAASGATLTAFVLGFRSVHVCAAR